MITVYCINHTCKLNDKCARYARNNTLVGSKTVKNFPSVYKCDKFIPL